MIRPRIAALGLLTAACLLWVGCGRRWKDTGPAAIRFTQVPLAQPGDPNKLTAIGGEVAGAQGNQRVVLYAKSDSTWWVQPYADQPFTTIERDSSWHSSTHPGVEYAALLVGPEFHLIIRTNELPTDGVIATAVTKGLPPFWKRWWFLTICGLAGLAAIVGFHLLQLKQMRERLNVRFEERLAERTRVAGLLHDTLLQGVISASMQLHVAVDQLPPDSPMRQPLSRTLQSMGRVVEEGRNTLQALQSPMEGLHNLERSLAHVAEELNLPDAAVRVNVKGPVRSLRSSLCAELYAIGREALIDALDRRRAKNVEVELLHAARELRLLIRDDGERIATGASGSAGKDRSGFSELFARAKKIGADLKVRHAWRGTQLELRVPDEVAFEAHDVAPASGWTAVFRRWNIGRWYGANMKTDGE